MNIGKRTTLGSTSAGWVLARAADLGPDERGQGMSGEILAGMVGKWVQDATEWPRMLELYEQVTGDRLRPPTDTDAERVVGPALERAFRRGTLVALPPRSFVARQKDEGVHIKGEKIEARPEPGPKKVLRRIKEKSFLDVQVVNAKGRPLAGRHFKLQLPDGRTETGVLGSDAHLQRKDIDPGTATLTLVSGQADLIEGGEPVVEKTEGDTIVIFLQDEDGQPMANARYRLRVGSEVREGVAGGDGRIEEKDVPSGDTCKLAWGPSPTGDDADDEYAHEGELSLDVDGTDDDSVDRQLSNLGYVDGSLDERLAEFHSDYDGDVADVMQNGTAGKSDDATA